MTTDQETIHHQHKLSLVRALSGTNLSSLRLRAHCQNNYDAMQSCNGHDISHNYYCNSSCSSSNNNGDIDVNNRNKNEQHSYFMLWNNYQNFFSDLLILSLSSAVPADMCVYTNNKTYAQGSTWTDGCSGTCQCVDTVSNNYICSQR